MFVARRERLIEWGDCDPARIVFNPRYFEWFDGCTAHVFAAAGFSKASLFERYRFAGWPLVETRAKFLRPSRFGETVLSFTDPDGMRLALIGVAGAENEAGWSNGDVPAEHAIRGFHGVTLLLEG